MLPPEAPVAIDIDFACLARLHDFAGGTIRNVVLRAAFKAASNGRVITQELLESSAEDESRLAPPRIFGFARRKDSA